MKLFWISPAAQVIYNGEGIFSNLLLISFLTAGKEEGEEEGLFFIQEMTPAYRGEKGKRRQRKKKGETRVGITFE